MHKHLVLLILYSLSTLATGCFCSHEKDEEDNFDSNDPDVIVEAGDSEKKDDIDAAVVVDSSDKYPCYSYSHSAFSRAGTRTSDRKT